MNRITNYVKGHKLVIFLILLVVYLVFFKCSTRSVPFVPATGSSVSRSPAKSVSFEAMDSSIAPIADTTDRKVVTNANFSLLVKNVSDSIDKIKTKITSVSGYVIDINIVRGETSESATLTLRVPSDTVDDMSKYLRSISAKVVSENTSGKDITDQYVDVETRIAELQKVKSKLEQIMNSAATSDEMLRVFNQITNINNQIDSYKGRLKYMDGASSTSKLTVVLSTDELSLPYSPAHPWRPEVVFKTAVRSLFVVLQGIGTVIIWAIVFSPVVLIAVATYLFIKKRRRL